jgi:hypothetical protein
LAADTGTQLLFDPLPTGLMTGKDVDPGDQDDWVIRPLDEVMAAHIRKALDKANGKVEGENGAASMLGINPGTLRGRMKKLNVPYGRGCQKERQQGLLPKP